MFFFWFKIGFAFDVNLQCAFNFGTYYLLCHNSREQINLDFHSLGSYEIALHTELVRNGANFKIF